MKIRFNTHTDKIPLSLEGIEHGFGLYAPSQMSHGSFKFLSKIVNLVNKASGQPDTQGTEFLVNSGKSIKYLEDNYTNSVAFQLNVDTLPNAILGKILGVINRFSNSDAITQIERLQIFSSDQNFYQENMSGGPLVVVGNNKKNPIVKTLLERVGDKKTFDFILFHEFGHHLEAKNKKNSNILSHINDLADKIASQHRHMLFDEITDGYMGGRFLHSFSNLSKEIYADTASLLISRNKFIKEGTYQPEEFLDYINHIHDFRVLTGQEYPDDMEEMLPIYSHYTTIVSDVWRDKLLKIEKSSLSIEEMDRICTEVKEIGVSRAIYTLMQTDNKYKDIFKVLSSYSYQEGQVCQDKNRFKELKSAINQSIGTQWTEDFKQNKEKVEKSDILLYPRAIFNMAFKQRDNQNQLNLSSKQQACRMIDKLRQPQAQALKL